MLWSSSLCSFLQPSVTSSLPVLKQFSVYVPPLMSETKIHNHTILTAKVNVFIHSLAISRRFQRLDYAISNGWMARELTLIFSDMTPYSFVESQPVIRRNISPQSSGPKIESGGKLDFLGLYFDPEGGGYMALRNVFVFRRTTGNYIRDVIAQSAHRCWRAGRPGFESRQGKFFLFSTAISVWINVRNISHYDGLHTVVCQCIRLHNLT
jgi:hypothetical protein